MDSRHLWIAAGVADAVGAALLLTPHAATDDPEPAPPAMSAPPVPSAPPPAITPPDPSTIASPSPPSKTATTSSVTPDVRKPSTAAKQTQPMHTQAPTPPKQARAVIVGFARDFTDTDGGHADWRDLLSRWVSTDLAKLYQHTAISRVPTGTLVQLETVSVDPSGVVVLIRYDSGLVLACRAEPLAGRWRVTAVEPVANGD